jgi:hypothetical protein
MPCVGTFNFRARDSSKDIQDITFKTSCPVNQPFSAMKKIEVPKLPSKFKKSEISPIMINDNLGPTNTDIRILSKYLNRKKHFDINDNLDITNNGK